MPEGLEELLSKDPARFAPEVSILTSVDGDTRTIEQLLKRKHVTYTVRRTMEARGISLHSKGLEYSGPTAAKRFLKDRELSEH